jgi:hypothetical protein
MRGDPSSQPPSPSNIPHPLHRNQLVHKPGVQKEEKKEEQEYEDICNKRKTILFDSDICHTNRRRKDRKIDRKKEIR